MFYLIKLIVCLAYADVINIFRRKFDHRDCETLHTDVNTVFKCNENLMSLNTKNCQVISFTKNKTLDRVVAIRDLGVIFDSARPHYDQVCSKAARISDIKKMNLDILFIYGTVTEYRLRHSQVTMICVQ